MFDERLYTAVADETKTLHCDQRNYNHNKIHITSILLDNYDHLVELDHSSKARPCILDNVQKSLLCGSHYLGYDVFICPVCENFNFIPHSCHAQIAKNVGSKDQNRLLLLLFLLHLTILIDMSFLLYLRNLEDSL